MEWLEKRLYLSKCIYLIWKAIPRFAFTKEIICLHFHTVIAGEKLRWQSHTNKRPPTRTWWENTMYLSVPSTLLCSMVHPVLLIISQYTLFSWLALLGRIWYMPLVWKPRLKMSWQSEEQRITVLIIFSLKPYDYWWGDFTNPQLWFITHRNEKIKHIFMSFFANVKIHFGH